MTRREIVPTFRSGLVSRMRTEQYEKPAEAAVRAKDAGVELLAMLGESERVLLGGELLRWVVADVEQRADVGMYSLEAIAERVLSGLAASYLERFKVVAYDHPVRVVRGAKYP